jgi:hypothetical protein
MERVDVVDTLADVAPLVEQVLVHVGKRGRVRVDADVPGEDLREPGSVGADEVDRDGWLQHAVALRHASDRGIETRLVQRVRQRSDQP